MSNFQLCVEHRNKKKRERLFFLTMPHIFISPLSTQRPWLKTVSVNDCSIGVVNAEELAAIVKRRVENEGRVLEVASTMPVFVALLPTVNK